MTIAQLLMQPLKQKIGGFALDIKTHKKNWQVGKVWWCQVICMDETGEMPVDVKIGEQYNPIRGRASQIQVIVAEVQEAEYLAKDRKKLVVDQFSLPTTIDEPPEAASWSGEYIKTIRSKIKCWLVAAYIEAGNDIDKQLEYVNDPKLGQIIDRIIEG